MYNDLMTMLINEVSGGAGAEMGYGKIWSGRRVVNKIF